MNARTRAVGEVTGSRVLGAARHDREPRPHRWVLDALDLDEELALEHVHRLVGVGCRCRGVIFPSVMTSSSTANAPPVSSAVHFQVCTPPP